MTRGFSVAELLEAHAVPRRQKGVLGLVHRLAPQPYPASISAARAIARCTNRLRPLAQLRVQRRVLRRIADCLGMTDLQDSVDLLEAAEDGDRPTTDLDVAFFTGHEVSFVSCKTGTTAEELKGEVFRVAARQLQVGDVRSRCALALATADGRQRAPGRVAGEVTRRARFGSRGLARRRAPLRRAGVGRTLPALVKSGRTAPVTARKARYPVKCGDFGEFSVRNGPFSSRHRRTRWTP